MKTRFDKNKRAKERGGRAVSKTENSRSNYEFLLLGGGDWSIHFVFVACGDCLSIMQSK